MRLSILGGIRFTSSVILSGITPGSTSREKYHQFPPNVRSFIVVLSGFIFWTNLRQNSQEIQSRYKDKVWEAVFLLLYTRFWAMNNSWYFSETEWNVFGWLLLETVLSNCYKCLWTQGFVSFFCISIYNSLKLISPLIVLLLSIFMKVVTITLMLNVICQ